MKIGFDLHGVVDKEHKFFSLFSNLLISNGHEVHIITGQAVSDKLKKQLADFGVIYTRLFSIVDYHQSIGTKIRYESNGPWIEAEAWNKTKANYCEKENINIHIDDSRIYGQYFKGKTIYILFDKCQMSFCNNRTLFNGLCREHHGM